MIPPDLGSRCERRRCDAIGSRSRGPRGTTGARDGASFESYHRSSRRSGREGLGFGPTASVERTGGHFPPNTASGALGGARWGWGRRCVTPRQTCPRPNGLGRNLRSKTRWFTGFCNSHQVSHFATFFIDARAEISVAESRFRFSIETARPRARTANGLRRRALSVGVPWRYSRRGFVVRPRGTVCEGLPIRGRGSQRISPTRDREGSGPCGTLPPALCC